MDLVEELIISVQLSILSYNVQNNMKELEKEDFI
jgi:hypothetical protein